MKRVKFIMVAVFMIVNVAFTMAGNVILEIEPPRYNGGSALMYYIIEYQDTEGDGRWMRCENTFPVIEVKDEKTGQFHYVIQRYTVTNLAEGKEYIFRVKVVNLIGEGPFGKESTKVLVGNTDEYIRVKSGDGAWRRSISSCDSRGTFNVIPGSLMAVLYREEESIFIG